MKTLIRWVKIYRLAPFMFDILTAIHRIGLRDGGFHMDECDICDSPANDVRWIIEHINGGDLMDKRAGEDG